MARRLMEPVSLHPHRHTNTPTKEKHACSGKGSKVPEKTRRICVKMWVREILCSICFDRGCGWRLSVCDESRTTWVPSKSAGAGAQPKLDAQSNINDLNSFHRVGVVGWKRRFRYGMWFLGGLTACMICVQKGTRLVFMST
jgi:hypothetical protein